MGQARFKVGDVVKVPSYYYPHTGKAVVRHVSEPSPYAHLGMGGGMYRVDCGEVSQLFPFQSIHAWNP